MRLFTSTLLAAITIGFSVHVIGLIYPRDSSVISLDAAVTFFNRNELQGRVPLPVYIPNISSKPPPTIDPPESSGESGTSGGTPNTSGDDENTGDTSGTAGGSGATPPVKQKDNGEPEKPDNPEDEPESPDHPDGPNSSTPPTPTSTPLSAGIVRLAVPTSTEVSSTPTVVSPAPAEVSPTTIQNIYSGGSGLRIGPFPVSCTVFSSTFVLFWSEFSI